MEVVGTSVPTNVDMMKRSQFVRALPCLTVPSLGQHLHPKVQTPQKTQVPLKRPKEAESSTSELLNLVVQANVWPVEFPDNINAPGNIFARPYQIHYPACGSNYPSRPEFRGWNCKTLADNKADLFTVVNNLSTSSSSLLYAVSAAGPITAWEQQLLFAVAMQETESMSGGDPSKMGDTRGDENFSCLNMNWQALEWAGYSGSRYDIRTDPQARSNASILSTVIPYFIRWTRGEARPDGNDQRTNGVGQGRGIASTLNMHRGGPCGYYDPSKLDCYLYRNAIASVFYKISENACDATVNPGCNNIYTNDMRIGVDVNYINNSC